MLERVAHQRRYVDARRACGRERDPRRRQRRAARRRRKPALRVDRPSALEPRDRERDGVGRRGRIGQRFEHQEGAVDRHEITSEGVPDIEPLASRAFGSERDLARRVSPRGVVDERDIGGFDERATRVIGDRRQVRRPATADLARATRSARGRRVAGGRCANAGRNAAGCDRHCRAKAPRSVRRHPCRPRRFSSRISAAVFAR